MPLFVLPVPVLFPMTWLAVPEKTQFPGTFYPLQERAFSVAKKGTSGHLAEAKSLALQLMKDGSYQAECSDEGLMSDEICECLKPVIQAVKAAGGSEAVRWAKDMRKADRSGCLCDRKLAQLQGKS